MIDNRKNLPICVVCAPRTGSTALSDQLARQYNLTNFEEAFHPQYPQVVQQLLDTPRYLFNFKIDQLNNQNQKTILELYKNSHTIRLRRRDLVKHIASYYLLCYTKIPHYRNNDTIPSYQINIDQNLLKQVVDATLYFNRKLDQWEHPVDTELYYEDLQLKTTSLQVYPKPSNYDDLLAEIKNKLQSAKPTVR
jgi:translation elongation factor EF-G